MFPANSALGFAPPTRQRFTVTMAWLALILTYTTPTRAAGSLNLWDAQKQLPVKIEGTDRSNWVSVPTDLLQLEMNPPKAASDPGYYGRDYTFHGDAVVANRYGTTLFSSASGQVLFVSHPVGFGPNSDEKGFSAPDLGWRVLDSKGHPLTRLANVRLIRHGGDEIRLQLTFTSADPGATAARAIVDFNFDSTPILEIVPGPGADRFEWSGPMAHGIAPTFGGDDLLYSPNEEGAAKPFPVCAENIFLGLLAGERSQFALTWPAGNQLLQLHWEDSSPARSATIEFRPEGQPVYLALQQTAGIWHQEILQPKYLEAEVKSAWQRPFPAKWKTQLPEGGFTTTYTFHQEKGEVWRGVPGSYPYPVWFDGDQAFFHFSKKVPPKGIALIYFLEGQQTPAEIFSPADLLKASLGRPFSAKLLDVAGRKLRTHHRRGGEGVHRACTCGCTEAIQAIFAAGEEVERRTEIQGALDDMIFFVQQHVARIDEYRHFAQEMQSFLKKGRDSAAPEVKTYLESLQTLVEQIPQEYEVQKENMKSPEHMADLTRQTLALTTSKTPTNAAAYGNLLSAWRAMGGAQDYVVAQFNNLTRKLAQEAAYGLGTAPSAISLAREVRARCRQILRNPDGYELWADY